MHSRSPIQIYYQRIRAFIQTNSRSSEESEIVLCKIENPIELGKTIEDKDCVLDIKLMFFASTFWTNGNYFLQ